MDSLDDSYLLTRNLGGLQNKNVVVPTEQLEEDRLAVADPENREQNVNYNDVGWL